MTTPTTIPNAPAARAAFGLYAIASRRRSSADTLIKTLAPMRDHAQARAEQTPAWKDAAEQLDAVIPMIDSVVDTPLLLGLPIRRAAVPLILDAITAFETAHEGVGLPHDEHGRYVPEPGTEYPFSVSDIGRAAVQLLGPDWHAESTSWGVGAQIQHTDGAHYLLAVDDDFDLYVIGEGDTTRTFLTDLVAAYGLETCAEAVADTLAILHAA
ncbi:hypothetical protein [Streptomyces sp. BH055]|uniref:hypothetical protein n=1 Tax=unclassified Streptomyces TaxID=2593676 RepID=UPI003BB79E26